MTADIPNLPPTNCRLLVDPPAPGAWNMALDEVLWHEAAETGCCTWRFYRWSEPTLSLGYFQPYDDRHRHQASSRAAIVRRLSGGGAITHDAELTYSFVLPAGHPLAARRLLLYEAVHAALAEALAEFGAIASLCTGDGQSGASNVPGSAGAETSSSSPYDRQPFLCFQRRSAGDVLVGGAKIAGSAQRRSRGAVLQHGSVLLGRSASAPELDALADLLATPPDADRLIDAWIRRLARHLRLLFTPDVVAENTKRRVAALAQAKYAADAWTRHRGRRST